MFCHLSKFSPTLNQKLIIEKEKVLREIRYKVLKFMWFIRATYGSLKFMVKGRKSCFGFLKCMLQLEVIIRIDGSCSYRVNV